jgi:acetylglutamate kinase
VEDGVPEPKLGELAMGPTKAMEKARERTGRVRLAGLAAARHGVDTALAAARALGMQLVVRVGDGTEPEDLVRRDGVAVDDGPVDVVICPAVCETYADELRAAHAAGVPVVASPGASTDAGGPDPFDADAFARAIAAALRAS